jgi:hypothetical protein
MLQYNSLHKAHIARLASMRKVRIRPCKICGAHRQHKLALALLQPLQEMMVWPQSPVTSAVEDWCGWKRMFLRNYKNPDLKYFHTVHLLECSICTWRQISDQGSKDSR